jgi:release factor glutamine methyltransferase
MKLRELIEKADSIHNNKIENKMLIEDIYETKITELENHNFSVNEQNYYLNQVIKLDFLPLQYVSQKAMFNDKYYFVNKNVLIPKQETEQMIKIANQMIKDNKYNNFVDIGTGSGIIAIELGLANPGLNLTATDISNLAIEVAEKNAKKYNQKINFICCDLITDQIIDSIDFIVANLPYLHDEVDVHPKTKNHEPHLALYSPEKGTLIFQKLFHKTRLYSIPMLLEVGHDNAEMIITIAKNILHNPRFQIIKDINNINRFILIDY